MENVINIKDQKDCEIQYITCIDNSIYYHWQIELLIQSLRQSKNNSKLIVAIPNQNKTFPCIYHFYKNLSQHPDVVYYQELPQKDHLGSVYVPWIFSQKNILPETFCLISCDCIFQKPIVLEERSCPEIHVALDPFFNFELATSYLGNFWSSFGIDHSSKIKDRWIPLGQAILFNKISTQFFEKVVQIAETLVKKQIEDNQSVWEMTPRVAWILAMIFYSADFQIKNSIDVQYIISNNEGNFVTYEHGMNDMFNKKQFLFLDPHFLTAGDPIEYLGSLLQTKNSSYVSEIARASIANR